MSRLIVRFSAPLFFIVALFISFHAPLYAQQTDVTPPDYRINAEVALSDDQSEIIITLTVYNSGGPAEVVASIVLLNLRDGSLITPETIETVRPLGSADNEEITLRIPVALFPPGSGQSLQISVGIGEIEAEDAPSSQNNRGGVLVTVPNYDPALQVIPTSTPAEDSGRKITLPFINRTIDLADPTQALALAGVTAASGLMLIILGLILRLMFRRTPAFGNWQPPYATMPPLDPNSTYGRRQLWQQHAQNNALPLPCKEGGIHARKVLLGMDGYYLSGWKIKAARMTQYDMYGRVARSQIFAAPGQLQRLNRIAHKSHGLDAQKMMRRVRPVARSLARQFKTKVNKRSAMLPIALDVRFQGTHGEVRILFELYQCGQGQLHQIDIWEPEMTVVGRAIQESYTLTIFGQTGNESYKDFKNRLQEDITRVLADMLLSQVVMAGASAGAAPETAARTQPVQINSESEFM